MMALDTLVSQYVASQQGVRELGEAIRRQGRPVAVAFVDLAGSSEMKHTAEPAAWLGYVQSFFEEVLQYVGTGTLVKRIGDEALLTFPDPRSCEEFLARVHLSDLAQNFPCRIAVDHGDCYHLKFGSGMPDDPYGPPVDRCARIVARAQPGTILCSEHFVNELPRHDQYLDLGLFHLRGMPSPERIFLYRADQNVNASYLEPLIERLNEPDVSVAGYRWISRTFVVSDFQVTPAYDAVRPFMLRQLLRVPKLPFDGAQVMQRIRSSHLPQPESEFIGYLVEWAGTLEKFTRMGSSNVYIAYIELPGEGHMAPRAAALLTPAMYEVLKLLPNGQKIYVRGIITDILLNTITLNYADIAAA